jgi:hypothetical protein
VAWIDAESIERDQHPLLGPVDHDHEAAVAAPGAMDRLPEAHLASAVPLPCLLVRPAVFRQQDLRHEAHRAWRWFHMKQRRQGTRIDPLRFKLPLRRVRDRQVVLLDAEQLFERVADAAMIAVPDVRDPAHLGDRFEPRGQRLFRVDRDGIGHILMRRTPGSAGAGGCARGPARTSPARCQCR